MPTINLLVAVMHIRVSTASVSTCIIVWQDDGHLKITDFGLARENITSAAGKAGMAAKSIVGTPEYFAPEILMLVPYGKACDWWTVGVLMFELMTGRSPFNQATVSQPHCDSYQPHVSAQRADIAVLRCRRTYHSPRCSPRSGREVVALGSSRVLRLPLYHLYHARASNHSMNSDMCASLNARASAWNEY